MTTLRRESCPRRWEVSAAHDGRLLQKDLESMNRHVSSCNDCLRERGRIETLAQGLRHLPALPDDLLAARRMRQRLLAEVNGMIVAPAPRRPRWRWAAASALVVGVAASLLLRHRAPTPSTLLPSVVAARPDVNADAIPVEVTASAGSIWQKRLLADELHIDLSVGEIVAKIGPRKPGQRVRIQLPDGWIEDLGTTLSVRVEDGQMASVRVSEGRVLLQLRGRESHELNAGESWERSLDGEPPMLPHASAAPVRLGSKGAKAVSAIASNPAPPTNPVSTGTKAADAPQVPAVAAGAIAREEDELYLHIVALARAHQVSEARAAAKEYLARFPNGFRRDAVFEVANH